MQRGVTSADPAVSFVVLCYRFERFIGECLRSILTQEGDVPFEVIVVDDASPDQSVQRIREVADERVKVVVHEVNRGHAATINEALRLARAPLIARIDGDDRYRPGYLREMVGVFERNPKIGLAYADTARIDEHGRIVAESQDVVHGGADFSGSEYLPLLAQNFICAPTIMARRDAWLSIPEVPAELAFHDWYFTLLLSRDWPFFYRSRVLADYRIHGSNMHSTPGLAPREERSVLWLLDQVFADESSGRRPSVATPRVRRRAYAAHYGRFADRYFSFGQTQEAARCYFEALRRRPSLGLDLGVMRRLLGAYLGRTRYERIKRILKGDLRQDPGPA